MSGVTYGCGHRTGISAPSCPVCGNPNVVERCTCGSGAHPRWCATHPDEYDKHISDLNRDAEGSEPMNDCAVGRTSCRA